MKQNQLNVGVSRLLTTRAAKVQRSMTTSFMVAVALTAVLLLGSTSCDKDSQEDTMNAVNILATVSESATKAVAGTSDPAYTPTDGKLHLFYGSVGSDKTGTFTYVNNKWSVGTPLFWNDLMPEAANYSFFAVAPAIPAVAPAKVTVVADQSTLASYTASDLLVAYTSTPQVVDLLPLAFKHVLSQVQVTLTSGVEATDPAYLDPAVATLTINGVRRAYTLSYEGATSEVPAVATVSSDPTEEFIPLKSTNAVVDQASFKAVLPAQTFANDALVLTFTIGAKSYTWSKPAGEITTVAGKTANINLKVTKAGVLLNANDITLTDWDTNSEDSGNIIL